jgi:O-antigen/teichoic acid export membrane protein
MSPSPETQQPAPAAAEPTGRVRALLRNRSLRQRLFAPLGIDALMLATNLATGIIVARALGPSGRGEIAAILLLVQLAGWLFALGCTEAIAYRQAKRPDEGDRLLGTWLAIMVPLAVLAVASGEALLSTLLAAQSDAVLDAARLYLLLVVPVLMQAVLNGLLLGNQDFLFYNLVRLFSPLSIAAAYVALWVMDSLTVEAALVVNAAATLLALALSTGRAFHRVGVGRPERRIMRETGWYGARAHGGSIAGLVNARLDLLIIPAILSATSVGLYSVATNVAGIIGTLTGTVALIVLPITARGSGSPRTVVRTLQATLVIGLAIAVPLALLADVAVKLVYGADFGDAATALRLLLPGEVLDAGAMVLWSGLLAANRPFLSSVAAAPAAVLTIGGLLLFLESGGINAAATVTTCSFAIVFVLSLALYRHASGIRWSEFVRPPAATDPAA